MKKFSSLTRFLFILVALLGMAQLTGQVAFGAKQAQSSLAPYVVFVNGYNNCCAWSMSIVQKSLPPNAEIRNVPYSDFTDGAKSRLDSTDELFLLGGAAYINGFLDPNRPLILIGHSYGGDSVLKLLPKIKRTIQLVAVIDPVAGPTGAIPPGFRAPVTGYTIPSNVYYFFNRWQMNAWNPTFKSLFTHNLVPFDARETDGYILNCSAKICDQQEQSLAKNPDGTQIRISCEAHEVSCEGWHLPYVNLKGYHKGSNGTKVKRLAHEDMPLNGFLQTELIKAIKSALPRPGYFNVGHTIYVTNGTENCAFGGPSRYTYYRKVFPAPDLPKVQDPKYYGKYTGICPAPSGYFNDGKTTYSTNGTSYCGFRSPSHYAFYRAVNPGPTLPQTEDKDLFGKYTGACSMPSGYFNDGRTTYFTNGTSYCGFRSPPHYAFYREVNPDRNLPQVEDPTRVGNYTGACSMPSGYFNDGRTTYFTNGTSFCGFASPKHLEFYKIQYPDRNLPQVEDSTRVGSYTGACPLPSGYFDYNSTHYYSAGDGTFCGFSNSQEYSAHNSSRRDSYIFGTLDRDPTTFMKSAGACLPTTTSSSSPTIESVSLREERTSGSLVIVGEMHFRDPDGDAQKVHFELVQTTAPRNIQIPDVTIDTSSEQQKQGATIFGKWECGQDKYSITLRTTILDRAGNVSNPYEYTLSCNGTEGSNSPSNTPIQNSASGGVTTQPPSVPSNQPVTSDNCPYDVCVTNIAVSPSSPKRNQDVTFTATFINKATEPRYYNWIILLFDPNKSGPNKGFGESPSSQITVQPGISAATITFTAVKGPGPCMPLYAQAATHFDATNKPPFPGSDGQPFTINFEVCP